MVKAFLRNEPVKVKREVVEVFRINRSETVDDLSVALSQYTGGGDLAVILHGKDGIGGVDIMSWIDARKITAPIKKKVVKKPEVKA